MVRTRLLALPVALALVAAACNGDDDGVDVGGAPGTGGELIAAISAEPERLDPHLTSSYASFQILENVYDTLVQPGDDLTMEPALAEEWETSDDDLTWTFTLRDGVNWHDGRELVADDVVFSYERIIEEGQNAYRFESVESVTAPDDATVVIEVSRPTPNLLALIGAFKGMAIVQPEAVEDGTIDSEPVGTGPFRFVSQQPDGEVVLEANDDYWQDGLPRLSGIRFRPIPDPTVKLTNLQSGEVGWADGVPPQQLDGLLDGDDPVVEAVPGGDYWYLAMNQEREPFDDVDVRRAVAFAIDREAVTEAALFGAATPNQTAIPEANFFHTDHAPFDHDPEQAEQLLADAGVDDLTMELLVTNEYPETVTAAEVIDDQLGEVGIDVTIREVDINGFFDAQGEGDFDAFILGWLGNIDPDDFYYAQHYTDANFNFQGYSNPEVDELLDGARQETDEDERKELYDQAVETIVDEVSYLYLYNPDVVHAWTPDVEGYDVRPDAAIRFVETSLAED
jgi:peptide/nickel transport system substrate-binding protein